MTYKTQYDNCSTWQEKVKTMSVFHHLQVLTHKKKWRMLDTSIYFGVSMGLVSENLKLAENLEQVKNIDNRNEALIYLKDKK